MFKIFPLAIRNLFRYTRRTIMTSLLIALGLIMVILLSGITGSFKAAMISTITDTALGQAQIHPAGYISAVDILPLHLNWKQKDLAIVSGILDKEKGIKAYSLRLKFGAMVSDYRKTAQMQVMAINPEREAAVCPKLLEKINGRNKPGQVFLKPGEIILPESIARGLGIEMGKEIVLFANNREGAMNGIVLKTSGILSGNSGPFARAAYIHQADARTLLLMDEMEANEIALKFDNASSLDTSITGLKKSFFKSVANEMEFHTWRQLSPFATIENILNLFGMIVKLILIFIVLISILDVMMMSVFERTNEIGTMAAMGTQPSIIQALFIMEGGLLSLFGALVGNTVGIGILGLLNSIKIQFNFGLIQGLILRPTISIVEIIGVSLLVLVVAVFAAFQPARRAARLDPVEALRKI